MVFIVFKHNAEIRFSAVREYTSKYAITGSSVLQVFHGLEWEASDIDILVPNTDFNRLRDIEIQNGSRSYEHELYPGINILKIYRNEVAIDIIGVNDYQEHLNSYDLDICKTMFTSNQLYIYSPYKTQIEKKFQLSPECEDFFNTYMMYLDRYRLYDESRFKKVSLFDYLTYVTTIGNYYPHEVTEEDYSLSLFMLSKNTLLTPHKRRVCRAARHKFWTTIDFTRGQQIKLNRVQKYVYRGYSIDLNPTKTLGFKGFLNL